MGVYSFCLSKNNFHVGWIYLLPTLYKQYNYNNSDSLKIWKGYETLFHDSIPLIISRLDNRNYTTTSPLSNWGETENFNHSSMHYWGVWHGKEELTEFKNNIGRFMVEYGFQSYPSIKTINKFASNVEQDLNDPVMKNRQKSYIGNGMITKHTEKWYGKSTSFEDFIIKSQQIQAIALKTAIQQHRKNQPHCMGSLFWQLNDCWPGPSWSIIDHYGNTKIAYEVVKKEFQPIIAVIDTTDKYITAHLINNSGKEFKGIIQLNFFKNNKLLWTKSKVFSSSNNKSILIYEEPISKQNDLHAEIQVILNSNIIYKDEFWFDLPKNR